MIRQEEREVIVLRKVGMEGPLQRKRERGRDYLIVASS